MTSLLQNLREVGIGMLSCLLAVSILGAVYAPVFEENRQEAQAIIAIDPSDIWADILSQIWAAYNYIDQNWTTLKERYLDGLVWTLMNAVIEEMLRSMTAWVSNGYEGQPTFLADPDGFFTGVADGVVGTYLASTSPLARFLCSPFSININYALSLSYAKTRSAEVTCRVSDIRTNIENFFERGITFNDGGRGWNNWFKVTQNGQYNPYGALFAGQEALSIKLNSAKEREKTITNQSAGFLSKQKCEEIIDPEGIAHKKCTTVTPGSTIEKQLNESLASGGQRLQVADEFNELLAAIFTRFVQDAFSSDAGFAGSFNPNDQAYIPRESPNVAQQGDPIQEALNIEADYRDAQQDNLELIIAAEQYKEQTYPPLPIYELDAEGNRTGNIIGYRPNNCHSGELTPELQTERTRIIAEIGGSNALLAQLADINARYQNALNVGNTNEQNQIMREFLTLQTQLHSRPDVQSVIQVDRARITDLINGNPYGAAGGVDGLKQQIDRACQVTNPGDAP